MCARPSIVHHEKTRNEKNVYCTHNFNFKRNVNMDRESEKTISQHTYLRAAQHSIPIHPSIHPCIAQNENKIWKTATASKTTTRTKKKKTNTSDQNMLTTHYKTGIVHY